MTIRVGSEGSGDDLPSQTEPEKIVKRCDAVELTTAVDGATSLVNIAGAVADLAETDVPAVVGMKFSAVAEVHSSADNIEGDPSIIRTSGQRSAVVLDPMVAPRKDCGLMGNRSVLEPLEYSVPEVSLEEGDESVDEAARLHP